VVTVTISPAERIARVIEGFPMSGVLLALGLLGLYIEFKTPGFGVPGIAGLLCLGLWFWGHHIAGLAGLGELVLFVAGVILLLLEIFVIPGFGLTGIAGLTCIAAAIFLAMVQHLPGRPFYVPLPNQIDNAIKNFGTALLLVFACGAILARYLPKTSLFQRIMLTSAVSRQAGYTASDDKPNLVGLRGTAATPLRPAGIGLFGDRRLSVVARGQFLARDTPIVIAETHGNRIVVDTVEQADTA
jgi:membrane-bound serine protease (ClpP class)